MKNDRAIIRMKIQKQLEKWPIQSLKNCFGTQKCYIELLEVFIILCVMYKLMEKVEKKPFKTFIYILTPV